MQTRLLRLGRIRPADAQAFLRQLVIAGQPHLCPIRVHVDGRRRLHGIVHALDRHPAARVAGQSNPVKPEVEDLLNARRIQHRNVGVHHGVLAVVRGGGRFAGVIVAEQGDDAAQRRGAGEVGVAQGVTGAIHAGAFAIPDGENAVVGALTVELRLLSSPAGGGGQILVDAGLKANLVRIQQALGFEKLLVVAAQR